MVLLMGEKGKLYTVYTMVFCIRWLLIARCARLMKKGHFPKKIGFDGSFDVTKCLQQIEMPDLLHVCA